ncbi:MAG: hypothetical protein QOE37_236 [Microbacteriaceae bacterium]|jgi:uncharacterized protein YndB with AHSA1/START domain|nr:hypothetical protein [Microbacteriaceae bacterium]
MKDHVARVERTIDAPIERVWIALTTTESHSAMMFGSTVQTDWTVGGPITWSGVWEGKPFTDKGEIVALEPPTRFEVTHFSPLSGEDDSPEHYHTIEWRLEEQGGRTLVRLAQDNNSSPETAEHSAQNWAASLEQLAKVVAG